MATIAALDVSLSANSASFVTDMRKSQRAVGSFSAKSNRALAKFDKGMGRAMGMAARFAKSLNPLGPLMGVAVVGGLVVMTKKSLDAADAIAKTSDAIGVSTSFLQENRHAAELSGVAVETMDKAFKQAAKGIGEARAGTGTLITLLGKMNPALLETVQAAGSTEEAIDAIFDEMAKMTNQTDRMALSAAAFGGRGGKDMVNMLKDGSVGLREMRQEARDLGLVLEEGLVRGAEEANDQLLRMQKVIGVRLTSAILEAAPAITELATAITDMVPEIVEGTRAFLEFLGVLDRSKTAVIKDEMAAITKEVAALEGRLISLNAVKPAIGIGEYIQKKQVEEVTADIFELEKRMIGLSRELNKLQQSSDLKININGGNNSDDKPKPRNFQETWNGIGDYSADIEDGVKQLEVLQREDATRIKAIETLKLESGQRQRLLDATLEGASAVKRVTDAINMENSAMRIGIDFTSQQGKAWAEAYMQSQQLADGMDKATREIENQAESVRILEDASSSLVDQLVSDLERGELSWKSLGMTAIRVMTDMLAKQAQLSSSSGSGFDWGSIFSTVGSLFVSSGSGVSPSSGGGLGYGDADTFAAGGNHSGGLRIVGENGPELEATGPSRIFNANQTKNMLSGSGGGGVVNKILNVNMAGAMVSRDVIEVLQQQFNDFDMNFEGRALGVVADANSRGAFPLRG